MRVPVKAWALGALLSSGLCFGLSALAQNQQATVPDAPAPQAGGTLPGAQGPIIPGEGQGMPGNGPSSSVTGQTAEQPDQATPPPPPPPPPAQKPDQFQTTPPEEGAGVIPRFTVEVNFVEVPVTVKDNKGQPVAGLTWRDFEVFENNVRQQLSVFSVDPAPLSVAFVIDQTLPSNVMDHVNTSLGAIQGALTPYDEVLASGVEDLKAGIELVMRETGQTKLHIFGESSGGLRAGRTRWRGPSASIAWCWPPSLIKAKVRPPWPRAPSSWITIARTIGVYGIGP